MGGKSLENPVTLNRFQTNQSSIPTQSVPQVHLHWEQNGIIDVCCSCETCHLGTAVFGKNCGLGGGFQNLGLYRGYSDFRPPKSSSIPSQLLRSQQRRQGSSRSGDTESTVHSPVFRLRAKGRSYSNVFAHVSKDVDQEPYIVIERNPCGCLPKCKFHRVLIHWFSVKFTVFHPK